MWWEQFRDPIMNELIRTALEENKDIRIAAGRIEEFQGRYGATRSALFPQISGNASADHLRPPAFNWPLPGESGSNAFRNVYQVSINANWELDIWGRPSPAVCVGGPPPRHHIDLGLFGCVLLHQFAYF